MESIAVHREDNTLRVSWEGIPGYYIIPTSANSQLMGVVITPEDDAVHGQSMRVVVSYQDDDGTYETHLTIRPIDGQLVGMATNDYNVPMEIG